ncbi:MAG: AEC family transporter [Bowdeniella nasicola]|nr:AEC family transporter [Bowdeniella nasicola]
MHAVINGLAVIWLVIGIGYGAGKMSILTPAAQAPLNRLVYHFALPAYVFLALAEANLPAVLGAPLVTAALSATLASLTFIILARWCWRATAADLVIGGMSSGLANIGYLGIPLAHYLLGSTLAAIPVLLFQLAFFSPLWFTLADIVSPHHHPSLANIARAICFNPLLWAAVMGMGVSLVDWTLPWVAREVLSIVAGAAVPCILIAFGLSFIGTSPRAFSATAAMVVSATVTKIIWQPLLAFAIAHWGFAMTGADLYATVAMAGLPTAQNAYVAAYRAGASEQLATGTVMATTIFVTPTLAVIAALLAP